MRPRFFFGCICLELSDLGSNSHICYRFACCTYFQTFMGCNYILFSCDTILWYFLFLCMKTMLFHPCIQLFHCKVHIFSKVMIMVNLLHFLLLYWLSWNDVNVFLYILMKSIYMSFAIKFICICFKTKYYSSFEDDINLLTRISRIKRINESFSSNVLN